MTRVSNSVQLIGNLGADPEVKVFDNGNTLCRLSVAVNEYFKDREGNNQKRTNWMRVAAWGKTAEQMVSILSRGSRVAINGKLINRQYDGKDGQRRYVTEVQAYNFLNLTRASDKEKLPF
ncbi:MAG: single-stranded DNA-binding protein [Saprospirales bacterium]|nr:MAG: single-stranded DNA-binding protein [Saprospirales bacterium]